MNSEEIKYLYDKTYYLGGLSKYNNQKIGCGGLKEFKNNSVAPQKLNVIKAANITGKVILDVGFARGEVLKYCNEHGAKKCIGIDYSPVAKEIASKHINDPKVLLYTLSVTQIDQILERNIDIVLLMNILEHVSTEEWIKFFSKLIPKLNLGFTVLATTPANQMGNYMNMHNNYFTVRTLHELLDPFFTNIEITKGNKFFIKCT